MRIGYLFLVLVSVFATVGCGEEETDPVAASCGDFPTSLSSTSGDMTLTSIEIDCESADVVTPILVVTHTTASAIETQDQMVVLCDNIECTATSTTWTDDLTSGQSEAFGVADTDPSASVIADLCAASSWPLQVRLTSDTSTASGTVCATVTN